MDNNKDDMDYSKPKREKLTITKSLQLFSMSTSAHGFFKIIQSTSKCAKYFWIMILLVTFIGLFIMITLLLNLLLQFNLRMETIFIKTPTETRPTVIQPDYTVCQQMRFTFISDPKFLFDPNQYVYYNNQSVLSVFNQIREVWKGIMDNNALNYHKLARISLLQLTDPKFIMRSQYDIILGIYHMMNNITGESFKLIDLPDGRRCVTYQPLVRNVTQLSPSVEMTSLIFSALVGDANKFENPFQSSEEKSIEFNGASIFLHEPDTLAVVNPSNGFLIYPDHLIYLNYAEVRSEWESINDRCRHLSNLPIYTIWQPISDQIRQYRYTQALCLNLQRQIMIQSTCYCISEFYMVPTSIPNYRTLPGCHAIPDSLLTSNSDHQTIKAQIQQRKLCHDRVASKSMTEKDEKKLCPLPCRKSSYEFDRNVAHLKSNLYKNWILSTTDEIIISHNTHNLSLYHINKIRHDNINKFLINIVQTMPKSISVQVNKDSLMYPLTNFFSDIGGVLGLFVGFSIITIFEFLELAGFFVFILYSRSNCNKNKVQPIIGSNEEPIQT